MKKFSVLMLSAVMATAGLTAGLTTLVRAQSTPEAPAPEETLPPATESSASGTIDLAALTCREFLKASGEEGEYLMIFLHGHFSGAAGETTIDGPALANASDNIIDGCINSPDSTLLSQFEANR